YGRPNETGDRMSLALTLVAIGVGAVLIAVWFDIRFPHWAPTDLRRMLMYAAAAWVVPRTAVHTAFHSAGDSMTQKFAALFVVAFPSLVFMFLVGFWMIKLAQRSLSGLH